MYRVFLSKSNFKHSLGGSACFKYNTDHLMHNWHGLQHKIMEALLSQLLNALVSLPLHLSLRTGELQCEKDWLMFTHIFLILLSLFLIWRTCCSFECESTESVKEIKLLLSFVALVHIEDILGNNILHRLAKTFFQNFLKTLPCHKFSNASIITHEKMQSIQTQVKVLGQLMLLLMWSSKAADRRYKVKIPAHVEVMTSLLVLEMSVWC